MRRREFLAGSLILAGLAATGCTARPPRAIAGEIAGASWKLGHRVREGERPKPRRTLKTEVAILGGGVAGLSAAWRLRRGGLEDFLLCELESELGGNSRSATYPAGRAPWAAHYLPVPGPEALALGELLRELDVLENGRPRDEYLCHEPQERLYLHGRWHDGLFPHAGASRRDLDQLQAFRAEIDRLRGAGFRIPATLSTREHMELDRISMAEFMASSGWDSVPLRWWVEYGCRDDYGCSLETTSAWAGLHYHAARAADEELLVWPEGNAWLTDRLAAPLGERALTSCLVRQVGRDGTCLVETPEQALEIRARRVIFCLPTFLRPYLLGEKPRPAFSYAPWTVANLCLEAREDSWWDNVLYDSSSLGYVVATHQSLATRPGPTVWTWYRPHLGDPARTREELLERSWESWRDEVLEDLRRPHPDLAERLERLDVMVLGHAMVRPVPGLISSGELESARRPVGAIHFAHSDLSGLSIFEEANYHGVRAAEEVLGTFPAAEKLARL